MQSKKDAFLGIIDLIEFRWSAFSIYSLVSIFSVSLRIEGFKPNLIFIRDSIIIGIGITSFTLLLLLVGFRALQALRARHKGFRYGVLLLLPLVGALRGVALYLNIDTYGYSNRIPLLTSTISSLLYTSIYYGGASLFINLILRKNRQFYGEFQRAAVYRLKRELEKDGVSPRKGYDQTMAEINEAIVSKVSNLDSISRDQIRKVSEEIKFQIQNVLRPLSHRLWVDSYGELRTGNPWQIIRDAITELRVSKTFIICYQFFIGIFGIGIAIGFRSGLVKSLIATGTTILLFMLFEKVWLRNRESTFKSSLFMLFLVTVLPVMASEAISKLLKLQVDFFAGALIAPALPGVLVLSAVHGLISRDKEFALSAARTIRLGEFNNFEIDSDAKSSRDLSEYLHHTLQSELQRISRQLDSIDKPETAAMHFDELKSILSRTLEDVDELNSQGIERLASVCQSWEGIAAISLATQGLDQIDGTKLAKVTRLIEEIINNSIRYGDATEIIINLVGRDILIDISVAHNGNKGVRTGEGLGSLSIFSNAEKEPTFRKSEFGVSLELTV
jgi:signal transduction histidine kinase